MKLIVNRSKMRGAAIYGIGSLAAAGLIGALAQPALAIPKSGVYDQTETIVSPRLTIKTSSHLTFRGNKMRLESTGQDFVPYIDIVDGQSVYHFIPFAKEAVRSDLSKTYTSPIAELQLQTQRILQGATKTGETAIGDINCTTYSITFPDGGKGTFYQDNDPKFPYFIKEVIVHADQQVTDTTTFENIKLDVPVTDADFTLPTGTKIDQAPPPSANPAAGAGAPSATPSDASPASTGTSPAGSGSTP